MIQEMDVTVLLFASLAEAAGTRRVAVRAEPGDTVASVRDRLISAYPALQRFVPTLLYALDEEYATVDAPVHAGATLALIPPVSGG
jgi:molybdopterin converting factor subunit 1